MHKWRNICPDALLTRIEEIAEARFYLLRQTGPTGFLVKEHDSETKFKVLLGTTHSCDCSIFIKEKELCVHILWILMKKFRIQKHNPVVYQLGLCERELNHVIYGKTKEENKPAKVASAGTNPNALKQKAIDKDDICPICQDDIYKTKRALTFCKFGCGNSVHITCIKIWADHQFKSTQDEIIKCPLCRTEFANYKSILNEHRKAIMKRRMLKKQKKEQDNCFICYKCKMQILSHHNTHRCSTCMNLYLCTGCFSSGFHKEHTFEMKGPNGKWAAVERRELTLSIGGLNFASESKPIPTTIKSPNGSILKKRNHLVRGRSSSHTDLRGLSLGISGITLHTNHSLSPTNQSANSKRFPSPLRLPPLPLKNKGLITNSPSRRFDHLSSTPPMAEDLVVFSSPIKSTPLDGR